MKPLFEPVASPFLVPFDGDFRVSKAPTEPPKHAPRSKKAEKLLEEIQETMRKLQRKLYADDRCSLLVVFQAMDAAGKDGTIRAVMTGVNPAGCQVFSFKAPSSEELEHDFLWRIYRALPERGRIGIFNRSHYEEVLVVRVHPELLAGQRLPEKESSDELFAERYESIREFEKHLARNGTAIVKFWLNVSRDEQRRRFLDRIDEPDSNWKFSPKDVLERERWDDYMEAYEVALRETSRPWAPWYAIPADHKPYMRLQVGEILVETMKRLPIAYPEVDEEERARMLELRKQLEAE